MKFEKNVIEGMGLGSSLVFLLTYIISIFRIPFNLSNEQCFSYYGSYELNNLQNQNMYFFIIGLILTAIMLFIYCIRTNNEYLISRILLFTIGISLIFLSFPIDLYPGIHRYGKPFFEWNIILLCFIFFYTSKIVIEKRLFLLCGIYAVSIQILYLLANTNVTFIEGLLQRILVFFFFVLLGMHFTLQIKYFTLEISYLKNDICYASEHLSNRIEEEIYEHKIHDRLDRAINRNNEEKINEYQSYLDIYTHLEKNIPRCNERERICDPFLDGIDLWEMENERWKIFGSLLGVYNINREYVDDLKKIYRDFCE